MKFSMRVKVVSILVVFMVMLASSAWANADSVPDTQISEGINQSLIIYHPKERGNSPLSFIGINIETVFCNTKHSTIPKQ